MAVWDIKERYDLVRANQIRGSKGFFIAGTTPSAIRDITTININTTGNATDFGGDVLVGQGGAGKGCNAGSPTRIVYGGGSTVPAAPANTSSNQISYFVPTTSGNAADFGDLTNRRNGLGSVSNNTRAVFGGGYDYAGAPAPSGTRKDIIDFVTIQSLGNATDFGDLQQAKTQMATCGSNTRGIWAGGHIAPTTDQIDFITIASTGNASDFGDLSAISESFAGSGDNIKGIVGGGNQGPYAGMDVLTIATTGNGTDFGNLTSARRDLGSTSNQIRQVFAGGAAPSMTNIIDFITIANLGDATDFGDLVAANRGLSGSSDSHNGLELGFFPRDSVLYMPGSGRAIIMPTGDSNEILEMFNVNTKGNTSTFGNLATDKGTRHGGTCSSNTRYIYSGGRSNTAIESVEFATEGNAADFGDLHSDVGYSAGVSSITRGIFQGGNDVPADINVIEYITIATAGNASDFGDLTVARQYAGGVCSPTRGICGGGNPLVNVIDYVTIASTGDSTDFGDLSATRNALASAGSSVRGLFGGGAEPTKVNTIEYITIASTGNVTDFGDLNNAVEGPTGSGNNTRGVFAGGRTPTLLNVMDFVTIASTGNASDFGDISSARYYLSSSVNSDSHGGLQS